MFIAKDIDYTKKINFNRNILFLNNKKLHEKIEKWNND